MKDLKLLSFFLCVLILFGCSNYSQEYVLFNEVQHIKSTGKLFEMVSAFTLKDKNITQRKMSQDNFFNPNEVYFLQFNKSVLNNLGNSMTLHLPLDGRDFYLELFENFFDYKIITSDNQEISPNRNLRHYHGVVKDNPNSIVAITFAEDEIIGLVATDEGNFNLALDRQSGEHIFYNDKNLKQKPEFICGTKVEDSFQNYSPKVLRQNIKTSSNKFVRLYFETEFDIYEDLGYNYISVETFITGLYNQVALLYRNEKITTTLSQIYIWTIPDPFTALDTYDLLNDFWGVRTSFTGDLAQLVTFRNVGGGRAFTGQLCGYSPYSVVQLFNYYYNVPVYSWSVMATTHEFGHLLGSNHTHDCVWNGNNTAIDGCEAPRGCPNPGIPPNGGTIMSYCHSQSVGVVFNLGFGLQPGNVIRNRVLNGSCLSYIITGPNIINTPCQSGLTTTYTITLPVGSTNIQWIAGPGLIIVSGGTTTTCSVQRTNSAGNISSSSLSCTFTNKSQSYIAEKSIGFQLNPIIAVGVVDLQTHQAVSVAQVGRQYYFKSDMPIAFLPYILEYRWELDMGGLTFEFSGITTQNDPITFQNSGVFPLRLRIRDACGWSLSYASTTVYVQ